MPEFHLTPELLGAVERGEIPARSLTELALDHLKQLCPDCRRGFDTWQKRRWSATASYEAAFRAFPLLLERHATQHAAAQAAADRDFSELVALSPEDCLLRIRRANRRFRGVLLADMLLAEARSMMPANTARQAELAEAADAVLLRSGSSLGYYEALARASAYRANAQRATGRLHDAAERFRHVRGLLNSEPIQDSLVRAEVDWLEGVLRSDQRQFDLAEELLSRAATTYLWHNKLTDAARPLVTLGTMYYYQRSDLSRAISITEQALQCLDPKTEPRLYLCCRHNLAIYLVDLGDLHGAADILVVEDDLYERVGDAWARLQKVWLLGRIAAESDRLQDAESAFKAVQVGFLIRGVAYDVAMVSLDLALVYLKQDRLTEVKALAQQMFQVFRAEAIHPEAQAALRLFEEALRGENLTAEFLKKLTAFLAKARSNPELRFRP